MTEWELDFGMVQYWETEESKLESYNMIMSYKEGDLPLAIKLSSNDGSLRSFTMNKKLQLEYINTEGIVNISGEIFNFTPEQLKILRSLPGKWLYIPKVPRQIPIAKRTPGETCYDFGLVCWYLKGNDQYVLAHMQLDFNYSQELPVALFFTVYDENRMPECIHTTTAAKLSADYLGTENNFQSREDAACNTFQHYNVCGQDVFLSDAQADMLNRFLHT